MWHLRLLRAQPVRNGHLPRPRVRALLCSVPPRGRCTPLPRTAAASCEAPRPSRRTRLRAAWDGPGRRQRGRRSGHALLRGRGKRWSPPRMAGEHSRAPAIRPGDPPPTADLPAATACRGASPCDRCQRVTWRGAAGAGGGTGEGVHGSDRTGRIASSETRWPSSCPWSAPCATTTRGS